MRTRGTWQGMFTIFRFNWPLYLAAAVVFLVGCCCLFLVGSTLLKLVCGGAVAGAGYFIFVSLGVSHLIYDRSDLYRWQWLERALGGKPPERFVVCHAGFDEVSEALRNELAPSEHVTLDHFDPKLMTEPSIHKARRLFPPTADTIPAPFDHWPMEDASADVVFGLLAIHEFRSVAERSRWFAEARRCLKPGGRILLAEHLRDAANFMAFGPGFLHFHSTANWKRSWESAGLQAVDDFRITPWIRITVIVPP